MPEEVTLGSVTLPVIPQRHAYLQHRLGPAVQKAIESGEGITNENLGQWLGGGAYEVLCALMPNLPGRMPEHTFQGYVSKEAYEAGEYDEARDESPTIDEIDHAMATALAANGITRLVELGKALAGPTGLDLLRRQMLATMVENLSSSSASPSGESPSPSTTTTPLTSTESSDSPSPESTAS